MGGDNGARRCRRRSSRCHALGRLDGIHNPDASEPHAIGLLSPGEEPYGRHLDLAAGGPGAKPPKATAGRLALGVAAVTSAAGPRVTVYGWQLTGSASASGATAASEVKARSCRTVPGGVVLNLTFFALVLPDGTVLEATGGSEFGPVADDPDCLEGTLRFQVPNGIRPSYVRYRDGRSTFAWTVG